MKKCAYILLFSSVFCTVELFLRGIGLSFPLCALFIFYCTVTFGISRGIIALCLCALPLDSLGAGTANPWSFISFSFVILLAKNWLKKKEIDSLSMNFVPGMIIPFIVWTVSVIFTSGHFFHAVLETFPAVLPAAFLSGLLLPAMIYLLDNLNEKLALPLYTDIQLKPKE